MNARDHPDGFVPPSSLRCALQQGRAGESVSEVVAVAPWVHLLLVIYHWCSM